MNKICCTHNYLTKVPVSILSHCSSINLANDEFSYHIILRIING